MGWQFRRFVDPEQASAWRDWLHRRAGESRFWWLALFGLKQAWASIFGVLLLLAIVGTRYVELPWLYRYDWLFVFAVLIQVLLLVTRLEKPREVLVIGLFHLVGLGMELFKTSPEVGSWSYTEDAVIALGTVPLFSGFMYAAVGSYMARAWRGFDLQFTRYPNRLLTVVLALLIYFNFFTNHYVYDVRWFLFAATIVLFWRTRVSFRLNIRRHRMPLLVAFVLIAGAIWLAENVATFTNVWLYPSQEGGWHPVSFAELGSWVLLMIISFVMVDLLHHLSFRKQTSTSIDPD